MTIILQLPVKELISASMFSEAEDININLIYTLKKNSVVDHNCRLSQNFIIFQELKLGMYLITII